jgi:hypothetical protein
MEGQVGIPPPQLAFSLTEPLLLRKLRAKAAGVNPQYFTFNLTQVTLALWKAAGANPQYFTFNLAQATLALRKAAGANPPSISIGDLIPRS